MKKAILFVLVLTSCAVCPKKWPEPISPAYETHLLFLREDVQANTKAREAFIEAARRWRVVGINFVITLNPPNLNTALPAFSSVIIAGLAAPASCPIRLEGIKEKTVLGIGWREPIKLNQKTYYLSGAEICNYRLGASCGNPQKECWISVAQHELGHALGLCHHKNSIMRDTALREYGYCSRFGFTKHDLSSLYRTILRDRLRKPDMGEGCPCAPLRQTRQKAEFLLMSATVNDLDLL